MRLLTHQIVETKMLFRVEFEFLYILFDKYIYLTFSCSFFAMGNFFNHNSNPPFGRFINNSSISQFRKPFSYPILGVPKKRICVNSRPQTSKLLNCSVTTLNKLWIGFGKTYEAYCRQ